MRTKVSCVIAINLTIELLFQHISYLSWLSILIKKSTIVNNYLQLNNQYSKLCHLFIRQLGVIL